MRNSAAKINNHRSARQRLLESPVHVLPLPPNSGEKLVKMGFNTVKEAFRAALAGRISSRRNGGTALENAVLTGGCTTLGHPVLTKADIRDFQPLASEETVADAIFRLNGQRTSLSPELLATSARTMLLPSTMHQGIDGEGISTLADLLKTKISKLLNTKGIRDLSLGLLLAHVFDYVFILHEQEAAKGGFDPGVLSNNSQFQPGTNSSSLSSWLDKDLCQAGQELLQAGKLDVFLFFRNTAGAIVKNGEGTGLTYLAMANSQENQQRFQIPTAVCEICTSAGEDQSRQCPHIAALVLKMMARTENEPEAKTPLPLLFKSSPWYVIGQVIYELFGQGGAVDTTIKKQKDDWLLTIPGADSRPWATWLLDQNTMDLTAALFSRRFKWLDQPSGPDQAKIIKLRKALLDIGRTTAEVELNTFNKRSIAQDQDESIWMWLASELCQKIAPGDIQIIGPGNNGLFNLTATEPANGQEVFRMTLPRAKTPDLVDALHRCGNKSLLLPAARAFTKIALADNGEMIISSLLQLNDGRVLNRQDLADYQYGHYYYLDNNCFLPVMEQDSEHTMAENPAGRPVTFHANKVPALLKQYHQAITAPENEVDQDLLDLDLIEMPDRLEVNSFAADDDWCYLSGQYGLGTRNISLVELLASRIEKNQFLPSGKDWLKLTDSPLEWFHNLGEERLWQDEQTGKQGVRLTKREMIMLSALIPNLELSKATKGGNLLQHLLDTDHWEESAQLEGIPNHLRDYQLHGISWLYHLYCNQLAGILADDMGLGKTHQALGLINTILNTGKTGKFLIVCPATVVPHWVEKIEKFFPALSHYVYHGSRRDLDKANGHNIYITTYGIIRRDTKTLANLDFEVVIYDEIQNLKNRRTDVYKAAAHLKGKVIVGMTGTPLENSAYDLKSIFDICLPGYLGDNRDFKSRYIDPLETEDRDPAKKSLARLINPFMLRRTREQVLTELPDIIEDIRTCELSDDQISLYRELTSGRVKTLMQMFSADQEDSRLPYMELLAVINYLKQICDHPCLIKKCTDPTNFKSGKWDLFVELLNECLESGMKVVVFSHYTRMLDLIEQHLTDHHISFCGLRGNMSVGRRHQMIKKFNTDDSCQVFSASLLAGGVGVDLTAAQAVIHYDRWWNAAREDQATARVHRMGQKNVVQVFKMITVGTLEEKINQMIHRKRTLASHLVRQDDAAIIKRLSRQELIDLLTEPSAATPHGNTPI
ncbi:MAG: DEAD/DEAH box helicase [Thermodesulfobacteriota bacterium]